MTSRHFYNSADGLVLKSLRGAILLNPSLRLHSASRTVYTVDRSPSARVAVICGGGAGHEPAYAGYTGHGMLTACVSGEIFASPSSKQILNTIRLAAFGPHSQEKEKRDVLVIMNNYTGDRLNFGLAIEKARVLFPQIDLASIVVADDVSLLHSPATQAVGPRGLAGNILVCKLLGALAHTGASLSTLKIYGDVVVENLSSIGVALEHCHVPGREQGPTPLKDDECEVGLGLHNETGVHRRKMGDDVKDVIEEMVKMVVEKIGGGDERAVTKGNDETVLFVNNLGGVSQLEMGALLFDLTSTLASHHIRPRRTYSSSYMTSLNASGFSVSLLNVSLIDRFLQTHNLNIDTYELLDTPTDAHSWLGVRRYWADFANTEQEDTNRYFTNKHDDVGQLPSTTTTPTKTACANVSPNIVSAIESACRAVLKVEKELTEYDTILGDGDCGHTFAAGAKALLAEIQNPEYDLLNLTPAALVQHIAGILEDVMGGTIGALFGIYLNAYSYSLLPSTNIKWNEAPLHALEALAKHTPAKPGDRTVIDALHPFCAALASPSSADTDHDSGSAPDLRAAVKGSMEGATRTKDMMPRLGRAAYVKVSEGQVLPMDPGAWGVAKVLEGFIDGWMREA